MHKCYYQNYVPVRVEGQQMLPVVQVNPEPHLPLIHAPTAELPSRQRGVEEADEQQRLLVQVKPVPHWLLTHAPAACVPSGQIVRSGQHELLWTLHEYPEPHLPFIQLPTATRLLGHEVPIERRSVSYQYFSNFFWQFISGIWNTY